jgi:hypothetical protein
MMQIEFDYTTRQNSKESQSIFDSNKKHFSNQCRIVLDALKKGERLTTASALIKYGIGDLRRRIKDLKDYHGIDIKSELKEGRYKEYYL